METNKIGYSSLTLEAAMVKAIALPKDPPEDYWDRVQDTLRPYEGSVVDRTHLDGSRDLLPMWKFDTVALSGIQWAVAQRKIIDEQSIPNGLEGLSDKRRVFGPRKNTITMLARVPLKVADLSALAHVEQELIGTNDEMLFDSYDGQYVYDGEYELGEPHLNLTDRQAEAISLLALPLNEIAEKMGGIDPGSVENHIVKASDRNCMHKNTLIEVAYKSGIIDVSSLPEVVWTDLVPLEEEILKQKYVNNDTKAVITKAHKAGVSTSSIYRDILEKFGVHNMHQVHLIMLRDGMTGSEQQQRAA